MSVSFIARHGGDLFLLSTVEAMYTSLQEQADMASNTYLSSNVISQEESAEIAKEKVGCTCILLLYLSACSMSSS